MVDNSRQESDLRWAVKGVNKKFNTSIQSNTDIFKEDLSPSENESIFRVTVSEDTGVTLSVRITKDNTTVGVDLNDGSALTANALKVIDVPVRSDQTYNFQFSGTSTAHIFQVDEVLTETG